MRVGPFPPEVTPRVVSCAVIVLCAIVMVLWMAEDPPPGFAVFPGRALTDLRGHWRCQD